MHKTICDEEYKCDGCNFIVQRNNYTHNCSYGKCFNCKQDNILLNQHQCFMQQKIGKGGYYNKAFVCNDKSSEKTKRLYIYNKLYLF